MNIKDKKVGDKIVARRIDKNGRFEFATVTITKVTAGIATVNPGLSFHRQTGEQTGPHVTDHLSKYEAFPPEAEEIRVQLALKEKGQLSPAWSPDTVRLHRALERLKHKPMHEIEKTIASHIVEAFGEPDDWVPEVPGQNM